MMDESQLDQCLKTLAERPTPRLTDEFNVDVWSKIEAGERTVPKKKRFNNLFSVVPAPLWATAAGVVIVLASWNVWLTVTSSGRTVSTVTGEVLDLACYYDDGGSGPDHAACARRCIEAGLPVGIKTRDGKVYLLVGPQVPPDRQGAKHQTLNQLLAPYAATTVTVQGRLVEKEGLRVVENAQLVETKGS